MSKTINHKNPFMADYSQGYAINRIRLLRILLNGKVECKGCGNKFCSGVMKRLDVTDWVSCYAPERLTVELHCGFCSHKGMFNMEPNPFMDHNNIDRYAALVGGYQKGIS